MKLSGLGEVRGSLEGIEDLGFSRRGTADPCRADMEGPVEG